MVGIIGVMALISVLTSLIVWWPLTGKWRQSLTIKRRASAERLNYDIHKTFGIYSAIVLFSVFISGVHFNLGKQFRWLVDRFSTTTPLDRFQSRQHPEFGRISLDEAMARVNKRYPEGTLYWISTPNDAEGVYLFTKHLDLGGFFMGRRQVVLDQYTGEILHVADPLRGKGGDVFLQWQWPLHSGQALRLPGRILVLFSDITCAVLFVTGAVRWMQKRRGHPSHDRSLA